MRKTLIILANIFLAFNSNAQELDLESFIERNFEVQDQDLNYEDIYESLFIYYTRPLDINKASADQLSDLYILTPRQIESLLTYRVAHGKLLSIYELQVIPEWDIATIRKLEPFITVGTSKVNQFPLWYRITHEPNSYLMVRNTRRLETARGFKESDGYIGNQDHLYARLRISQPDDFSLGFTAEKDPGEQIAWNQDTRGFDHFSAHFQLQNLGLIDNVIIGDYQLQFGQGLVLGAGFAPGKGSESILTVRRGNSGLRPFASVIESGFFRGAATTIKQNDFYLTGFVSKLAQDGNRITDSTYSDFEEFVNSIQSTGLHRTKSELASKNNITEMTYGLNMLYAPSHLFNSGISIVRSVFDIPIQKKPNNYNQFEFAGNQNTVIGGFANYNWQNLLFFSELAMSQSGGRAAVGGMIATITPKMDLSILARSYDRDYHSFYANAFSENSRTINEQGVYWGIKYQFSKRHILNAYYDKYYFPWLKFRTEAPSDGEEWLVRYQLVPSKQSSFYVQLRRERKEQTITPEDSNLSILQDRIKYQSIINMDTKVTNWLTMKSRLQYSQQTIGKSTTSGILILQDFVFNYRKWKVSTRFSLFDTEDYDNRQYVNERNVLYAFSLPAYSGQGIRKYAMLEYRISKNITLYSRYARFDYRNVENIGSGLDETKGSVKSEINGQIRIRF